MLVLVLVLVLIRNSLCGEGVRGECGVKGWGKGGREKSDEMHDYFSFFGGGGGGAEKD